MNKKMQSGIAVIKDGEVPEPLALPIEGLMTDSPILEIQSSLKAIENELETIGFVSSFDFLLTLAFLSLPVIPDIKLTHQGLFDVKNFKHITIQA